jgi:hypothetical protein
LYGWLTACAAAKAGRAAANYRQQYFLLPVARFSPIDIAR